MTKQINGSGAASYADTQNQNCARKTWRQAPSESARRIQVRACRSFLLAPGSQPDNFPSARAAGGDGIIIDLESTVAPADKDQACEAALAFFRQSQDADFVRMLRINSPLSVEGLHDLLALRESGSRPDALVIPKCKSAEVIRLVAEVLGGAQSTIGVVPMVEPAQAIFIADDMAQAHERVCGLFFGSANLTADLNAEGSWGKLAFARSWIGAAALSMGIAAIDAPHVKGDGAGLWREAAASHKLGMTSKAALHVDQLATINAVFTPTAEAAPRAGSVIAA